MIRKALLGVLALVGLLEATAAQAHAGYSVYIYNVRRPYQGWFRSGFAHDVNASVAVCVQSILRRIADNRRYRTDFEAFGISPGMAQRVVRPQLILYVPPGARVAVQPPAHSLPTTELPAVRYRPTRVAAAWRDLRIPFLRRA